MDVMAQKQEEQEAKKKAEEEEKRAKLRAQIEAANKAAEEERQRKFGEKKTFYRDENDAESTSKIPPVEENKSKEELTLDESFRQSFTNDPKAFEQIKDDDEKTAENIEAKVNEKIEEKDEEGAVLEQKADAEEKKEELKPENSGQINLNKMKQYAPLDDQEFISSNEMPQNDALTELPEVFTKEENIEENAEYAKALKEGDAKVEEVKDASFDEEIEKGKFGTGSFAAVSESEGVAGATGTFAPVQEELIQDASKSGEIFSKDEMVVADADDSVYKQGEFTDTGAFAGKGYVDMPDEKKKGFFSKFGKKDKGSGKHATQGDNIIDDSAWEGGAFSNIAGKIKRPRSSHEEVVGQEGTDLVDNVSQEDIGYDESFDRGYSAPITSAQNRINSMVDPVPDFDQQIQEFRNASINMEVWMVALGSEIDENAGIKAFLLEHAQELRGAIIVDIEGLGAGDLCLINSEGVIGKSQTSSRMKRYVRSAANKLGVVVQSVDVP